MPVPRYGMTLLPLTTLAAAGTVVGIAFPIRDVKHLVVEAKFVRAGGGTDAIVYVQTSLDIGVTWIDIMAIGFLITTANKVSAVHRDTALAAGITPGDAALTVNTILNGLLGDRIRAKLVTTGTYTGASSLEVHAAAHK